jgi:hypothetical protein
VVVAERAERDVDSRVRGAAATPHRSHRKAPLSRSKRSRHDAASAQRGFVDRWDERTADARGDEAQDRFGRARRDDPSGRGAAAGQGPLLQLVMDRARVSGGRSSACALPARSIMARLATPIYLGPQLSINLIALEASVGWMVAVQDSRDQHVQIGLAMGF